jgi:hypothetical protein
MHRHHENQAVGSIAVERALDAAEIPLLVGEILDRFIGHGRAGVEEDVEIDAAER